MIASPIQIYLIPGFFGFTNFGRLVYFTHVSDALERELRQLGFEPTIRALKVPPTASLRTRSGLAAAQIAESLAADDPGGPIALVGHSSGGLDARLIASPGVDLEVDADLEALASRVTAVVSVCSPHLGTPLASLFNSLLGQKLLQLLSLLTVGILREAHLPLSLVARIGAALARARLPGGKTEAVLDHLHEELLGLIPTDERDEIGTFFEQVGQDQSLMGQITLAGADLLAASAGDRETARYGSVVARAPRPSLRNQLAISRRLEVQAGYMLYRWLHRAAGDAGLRSPRLDRDQLAALRAAFSRVPGGDESDAIVPTLSQVHGRLVWCGAADHLDVIGHFHSPRTTPAHHDWLMTGADFDVSTFADLWRRVARFIGAV